MAVEWTPKLSVGVESIDNQHKVWFEKANALFEAGQSGKAKEYIIQMFDFLDEYTKQHFKDEEKYMSVIGYPGIDLQKKAHSSFITELAKLKEEYHKSGGNILLIINANKMIINWLTKHISSMDTGIGDFARTANRQQ